MAIVGQWITLENALYWLIAANCIAFILMIWDKHCAQHGRWRISETTLLIWSMAGGSIGALAASRMVRHKTRKQPIARLLLMIPCVQLGLAGAWVLGLLAPLLEFLADQH